MSRLLCKYHRSFLAKSGMLATEISYIETWENITAKIILANVITGINPIDQRYHTNPKNEPYTRTFSKLYFLPQFLALNRL